MTESRLLELLKDYKEIKGIFSKLEGEEVTIRALQIRDISPNALGFKVAIAREDYAFLTREGITVGGDRDVVYIHPFGSPLVYEVREKKKEDK